MCLSIGGKWRVFYREHPLIPGPVCLDLARVAVKESIVNKRRTMQALMDSIQQGEFKNANSMLAADFQSSGPASRSEITCQVK